MFNSGSVTVICACEVHIRLDMQNYYRIYKYN